MKAQMKAIMASAVVIALCLAAVGGVTYSWFSDSDQSEINVTAGTIDLTATVSGATVKSYGDSTPQNIPTDGSSVTTSLGGTVKYTISSEDGTSIIGIKFNDAAPGDVLTFNVNVSLLNTIKVNYSIDSAVYEGTEVAVNHPFIITNIDAEPTSVYASQTAHNYSYSVTLKMDELAENEYMGKEYNIDFIFKAVQYNAPGESTTHSVIAGENQVIVSSDASENASQASISFNNNTSISGDLNVSMIEGAAAGYTPEDAVTGVVLGGISATGADLDGTATMITFQIPGHYPSNMINIFHGSTIIIEGGNVATGITNVSIPGDAIATYDNSRDITTIAFVTEQGFSNYYVTGNYPVACDGKYYNNINDAVEAAIDGSIIKILKEIDFVQIIPTKNITIDLNGCTITSDTTKIQDPQPDNKVYAAIDVYGVTVKIIDSKGEGCIKATEYGLGANNDGVIILDSICVESEYACLTGNNTEGNMNFIATSCTLTSKQSESIYMSGQNICTLEKCTLNGGISARMGQITIVDSTINGMTSSQTADSFDRYWNHSGSAWIGDAIYVWGGTYTSDDINLSNTCNITIKGNSVINGNNHRAIAVYDIAKKCDQTININVESSVTVYGDTIRDVSHLQNNGKVVTVNLQGITLTTYPNTTSA